MSGAAASVALDALPFPSLVWFRRLADLMNENRARQEQLGYVDCVVAFRVLDAPGGRPWSVAITFEEFSVTDVREEDASRVSHADFALDAPLATWRAMIESIEAGGGRPALDQTLNHLSHMGDPVRVVSDDPLKRDLYFRYNQSLQEFVNACARFHTTFTG